ncbi:hypothetical protein GCM10011344_34190 [Dokdonia pacifica]|uniref:DUF922 domain-containing protein n=1 Tax=Dokdonia pacifica TaxID=1627892 RepID=A0A239BB53_9FLAO|nr:DUF922 domain-containing protein [Dokdonia pacifica]GGG30410.1 hypothetical protein GCM10011344_34190 [Dokdonia pacifica]SNS04909.1 protein of unknown function [Dokdonia pacifica]
MSTRHYKVLGIALVILCSFTVAPERIAWQPNKTLSWADFKGSPNGDGSFVASTSSGMSQSYVIDGKGMLDKNETYVVAHFYPEYSWYREKDTTARLLKHEQTHFDITEIHARLLNTRIQSYNFTSNSKSEVKALYEEVEKQRRAMQRTFDEETNHSINREVEKKWEEKIARLLLPQ